MKRSQPTHNLPTTAAPSHPATHPLNYTNHSPSINNDHTIPPPPPPKIIGRWRGLNHFLLIPLILSFLLNCTSASKSSGPPPLPSDLMFTSSAIMNSPVTLDKTGGTLTITACETLSDLEITLLTNNEPITTGYTTTHTLSHYRYYDRATPPDEGDLTTASIEVSNSAGKSILTVPVNLMFELCGASAFTETGADAANAIQINNAVKLELLSHLVNTQAVADATVSPTIFYNSLYYKLTAAIDLGVAGAPWSKPESGMTGKGFTPIGTTATALTDFDNNTNHFTGTFDCDNHIIANLYINNTASSGVNKGFFKGLFGIIGSGGMIMNCRLHDVDVTGHAQTGGLVGDNEGTITNSYVTGTVEATGGSGGGGLAGFNNGTITGTYMMGTVTGESIVGGLVGNNGPSGTINSSYADITVDGNNNDVGGLVGFNSFGNIDNVYAVGSVTGGNNVGGLIGSNIGGNATNVYVATTLSGTSAVGGLVGSKSASGTTSVNSYWDTVTSETMTSASGTGKTTAELRVAAPTGSVAPAGYVDWNKGRDAAGALTGSDDLQWNFTDNIYPRLINVPCANRQHSTETSCNSIP